MTRAVTAHRSYTAEERAKVVGSALILTDQRAADLFNIPRRTVTSWRNDPRLAYLREVAQDKLAQTLWQAGALALQQAIEQLPKASTRDAAVFAGIAFDKALLLTGMATSRTESVRADRWADELTPEEAAALRDALYRVEDEIREREREAADVG